MSTEDIAGQRQGDEESREGWRESAPNPTQDRIDREGPETKPGDASWKEDSWGEASPEEPADTES